MICSKCESPLPKDHNPNNGRYCSPCRSEYSKEHYRQNKGKHLSRRARNKRAERSEMRKLIDSLKSSPCEDCGESHPPWAMEFHHRDSSTKVFNIGDALRKDFGKKALLEEIEKCDLVCCLCHRYRTHGMKRGVG